MLHLHLPRLYRVSHASAGVSKSNCLGNGTSRMYLLCQANQQFPLLLRCLFNLVHVMSLAGCISFGAQGTLGCTSACLDIQSWNNDCDCWSPLTAWHRAPPRHLTVFWIAKSFPNFTASEFSLLHSQKATVLDSILNQLRCRYLHILHLQNL